MKVFLSLIIVISVVLAYRWHSSLPTAICKESNSSTPYCKYVGPVNKLYINEQGLALIFLEQPFGVESAKSHGYNAKSGAAMALDIKNNTMDLEMYRLLVTAFDEEAQVEIHARSVKSGYMKIDRVWLSK